jgi:hypothetical protein
LSGRERGVRLAAGACCWLAMAAPAARAQLVDCAAIRYASSYKIVIDDLFFAKPALDADADLKLVMDRLRFTVNNQLTALALQMRDATHQSTPLSLVSCPGRHPLDASEFDRDRAQDLTDSKVVLEVWGTLDGSVRDGKVDAREARVGYAVMPLRFYEFGAVDLPGVYVLRYPRSGGAPAGGFTGLLEQLPELDAYAALGVGLKAAKAKDFDLAVQFLKRAEALLGSVPKGASTLDAALQQALAKYVQKKTCETIEAALAYPAYQGGLRLVYATRKPC